MASPFIVKKYENRRLYDTEESRYITLEELAAKVRAGGDVRVLDAKSGEDLTQGTLAQIILESRNATRRLPVPLLIQLIRMDDDALSEFLGRYVSSALELYLQAKHGAQQLAPYVPMANLPFTATNALARMLLGAGSMIGASPSWEAAPRPISPPPPPPTGGDLEDLRREVDELRRSLQSSKITPPSPRKRTKKPKDAS